MNGLNIVDFVKDFDFRSLLHDPNYRLYLYDQYSDHEGLSKLFDYFDEKLKDIAFYLGLFMILKSNSLLPSKDINIQEYYTYLQYHYMNLLQVFGQTYVNYRWDESEKWDNPVIKWDDYRSSGVLDPKKIKAIMRFLQNYEQKTFNIFDFVKMCKEFCYREKELDIYVTDDSFINPTTIEVYYTKDVEVIKELANVISSLKSVMPDYIITFKSVKPKKKVK